MAKVRLWNPRNSLRSTAPATTNSVRNRVQANPSEARTELLQRIKQLQEENDALQDQLDKVADLAAAPEDGREEGHDELVDKLNSIIDAVAADNADQGDDESRGEADLGNE